MLFHHLYVPHRKESICMSGFCMVSHELQWDQMAKFKPVLPGYYQCWKYQQMLLESWSHQLSSLPGPASLQRGLLCRQWQPAWDRGHLPDESACQQENTFRKLDLCEYVCHCWWGLGKLYLLADAERASESPSSRLLITVAAFCPTDWETVGPSRSFSKFPTTCATCKIHQIIEF